MPEGDTIYRAAENVGRALTDQILTRVQGSHPAIRTKASRLEGAVVTAVRSYGKHHLVDTDAGLTIRTHMGMPGVWHVYERHARWAKPVGAARVILATTDHAAVCFAAPTVEVDKTDRINGELRQWGPDLTADTFDEQDAARRMAEQLPDRPIGDVLLDQRVMAGVGNVYKSEILFMHRLNPMTPSGQLEEAVKGQLVKRARQLLMINRERPRRITTGDTRRGRELWVYDRASEPCRRCRTAIESAWIGDFERVTYWCPTCQPDLSVGRM